MDDLVDDSFCLAYYRLSLRYSLISFRVSLFVLTVSAFLRQSSLGNEVSAASFIESTKCFWYSSMSEAFRVNQLKRFELKIFSILFWNVLISALAN